MELEAVVASGLAIVRHVHLISESVLAIHLSGAFDVARRRVPFLVGRHAGALHVRPVGTVIDVGQMAPELSLLDPAGDSEVGLAAGGRARDPSAAGGEIGARTAGWAWGRLPGYVGCRRGNDPVCDPSSPDSGHDDLPLLAR